MFKNLKNKIQEETGQDPLVSLPYRNMRTNRNSMSSHNSLSIDELSKIEEKDAELNVLRNELVSCRSRIEALEDEKSTLELSIKAGQVQKEMFYDETDKIQNVQQQEIMKLKSMLLFREQESLDQMNKSKQDQDQIQSLKSEITRIKSIESNFEDIQDELENLRRSSNLEKNQLITQLSAKEEEIRHVTTRLEISEQSRAIFTSSDSENDKIKLLLQERKMLENRLEEAHLHLYDIKSSWTSQNLTLENQLHRLSRQVAEETAEKRKAFEAKETLIEKIKQLEFESLKVRDELKQRDNKIKLMSEEVDDLNSSLRDIRLENEEEIEFLRSKVAYQESELKQTKDSVVNISEGREELEEQILMLQREKKELKSSLIAETEAKSQLQIQYMENRNEYHEQLKQIELQIDELKTILDDKMSEISKKNMIIDELQLQIDKLEADVTDKTKAIKILNQRLFDVKKTLQEEIKNNNSGSCGSMSSNAPAILIPMNDNNNSFPTTNISGKIEMDEVKFSYLKHVILKFLTSRELEAKHLIRAVSTLLYLSDSEEKLLYDTLDYRSSWFGTKPSSIL